MNYRTTITAVCVHPEGDSPIFGEMGTALSLDDEADGLYLVIEQRSDQLRDQTIRINPDEFDHIVAAAKMLLAQESKPSGEDGLSGGEAVRLKP